jgi:hypothetical protein
MFRALSAALFLVLAGGAADAAQPVRDTMIVPGERIGPVALGNSLADLTQALGMPSGTLHQGNATIYSWGPIAAQMDDKTPGITAIMVTDGRFETDSHIRVGLAALAVTAVLGAPLKQTSSAGIDTLDYDGISVMVANAMVVQIQVRK